MATATPCQTHGAQFGVTISSNRVGCTVDLPFELNLTEEEAETLEANMHNAMELVLARYWR